MRQVKTTELSLFRIIPVLFLIVLFSGCAGPNVQHQGQKGYVEISNPAFTMYPGAQEKIWVPREYVDNGVQRGGELDKKGYESVKSPATSAPQQTSKSAPAVVPSLAGITGPAGKTAKIIQHFGLVVAIDGDKVYFNLGIESGYSSGQILKVHRGGTVIEGLGLAPGELSRSWAMLA